MNYAVDVKQLSLEAHVERVREEVGEFVSCNNSVLKVTAVLTSFNFWYHLGGSGYDIMSWGIESWP